MHKRFLICAAFATGLFTSASPAQPHGAPRAISILPGVARACAGDLIPAQYAVRYADGTTATLGRDDLSMLVRRADAADPRPDGSWLTAANPLYAAYAGYRLSAFLAADTTVHADTVVLPAPVCHHNPISIGTSGRFDVRSAHVRLGVLATPFFDSVVVAVVEPDGGPPIASVLTPSEIQSGAIRILAPGKNGKDGRGGKRGDNGDECESGTPGDDGEPGEPGEGGGQVNIIVQTDAPWLAQLVAVSNPGGRGGSGGAGGQGGAAGLRGRSRAGCNPRMGRAGRNGAPGPAGAAGPQPQTTTVLFALLWPGSPIWSDALAHRALDALMEYTSQRAR